MTRESTTAREEAKSPSHLATPSHKRHENGAGYGHARGRGAMRTLRNAMALWGRTSIPFFKSG